MGWFFFELSFVQFLSILVVSRAHGEGQKQKCDGTLPFPLTVPLGKQVAWPNPTSQACAMEMVCVCVCWGGGKCVT